MILVLFTWIVVFITVLVWGFTASKVIRSIVQHTESWEKLSLDEYFFFGLLILSALTGIISVFAPIGKIVVLFVCLLPVLFLIFCFAEFKSIIINAGKAFSTYGKLFQTGLILLALFILSAVVQEITFEDTLTYHAQNIQWIQKYPVVPGLGNLHPRFAFNNMFFVVSSLFTFQVKDSLIFPLNGLCYLLLVYKLLTLFYYDLKSKNNWRAIFYLLTFLISLLVLLPNLNTPAPDIICDIIIIYVFILIINQFEPGNKVNLLHYILLNLMIFSCLTYKLSSLFLVPALIFFLNSEILKKIFITVIIASVIILPFLLRNYFLSGYLIYPFPGIDIFNTDWKIPIENVFAVKLEIESFAKIIGVPYEEVSRMKTSDWILPWFMARDIITKMLISINFLSIITLVIMILKKDFLFVKVYLLILINLIFWIATAPDPRFAHGFLFIGFSFGIAYIFKYLKFLSQYTSVRIINAGFVIILAIIIYKRIMFPLNTFKDPELMIIPAPFGTVETVTYNSNFGYRVTVPEGEWCYNTAIPCVSYPLENVFIRGESLRNGFKVVKHGP